MAVSLARGPLRALSAALLAVTVALLPCAARADGPSPAAATEHPAAHATATAPDLASLRVPSLRVALFCVGLLCAAFLVNRFAPRRRRRLRPTVLLFAAYALAVGLAALLSRLDPAGAWPETLWWVARLLELLVAINLATIAVFDLGTSMARVDPPDILADIVIGLAHVVAVIYTLHRAGFNLQGLIATSAVVSGVLGLSLAPTIGNILGGVALQLDNSINEGDWIQLDANTQGRVVSIRWRHTLIETRNWDTIVVPNATLLSASIMILGKRTDQPTQRRYWVYFNVPHEYRPDRVVAVVNEALQRSPIPLVAREPAPNVVCMDLARDGYASYGARFWLTDLSRDDPTASIVRERIVAALQRAGIPLATPTTHVALDDGRDEAHRNELPAAATTPGATAAGSGASGIAGAARRRRSEHAACVALLGKLELFRRLQPDEIAFLAERATFSPFASGEVMTAQGQAPHWLYVLARGAALVQLEGNGHGPPTKVAELHAPEVFGEMAVMTGEPRSASVVAIESSECYRLDKDAFREVLTRRPEVAQLVAEVLAKRRSELERIKHNLDADGTHKMMEDERVRLLGAIQRFFGLDEDDVGRASGTRAVS